MTDTGTQPGKLREEHLPITRFARLYSLGDYADVEDLWVICHGYGQLAARFIQDFAGMIVPGRLVVAPEGLHRFYLDPPPAAAANRRVGATWMTREDRDTDIQDYCAYLDDVVKHVTQNSGARPQQIRALGFSQGAATVFRWATFGESEIDQLILWAGEVPPDADMPFAARRLRNTRVILAHGTNDELVPDLVIARGRAALDAAGIAYETRAYEGAHHLEATLLGAIASAI